MNYQFRTSNKLVDISQALTFLNGLDSYYPDFHFWFVNKYMPSILVGNSSLILAESRSGLVGLALLKNEKYEKKIRCVRVSPGLQGRGLAVHLMDKALTVLDCDKPSLSVPEELLHDWSRILVNRFDFDVCQVSKGTYRKNKLEYWFNSKAPEQDI